ncbi:MAG: SurA N-terminal domain-containing protein [Proteobacteria bacterium]|nr:SurA N-terminal domain-containing protein [Pseudomonadota bacterium]
MLAQLRNSSEKPWAKVLMGILIFSFVGWGVANWIFGESSVDDSVARVGGTPIKMAAFEHEKGIQLNAMTRDQQKQIYTDRAALAQFYQQLLSRLSSQIMLEKRAEDLGFAVTTGTVADAIHQTPAFQDNGRFSLEKFDGLLAASGMTEDYFAESVRRQILRGMVLMGIVDSAAAPDFAATAMHDARHAIRNIEYATVKYSDFKADGNPTDDQLRDVYAKNPKMLPEYRTVSYVLVPVKNMAEPDLYDSGYTAAQKLEDTIVSGDTLSAAAKKTNAKYVNLGAISADKRDKSGATVADPILTDARVAQIFGMEQGLESEITETKLGFAIFRVEHVDPAAAVPMDAMRNELTAQWRREEQKKQAYLRANDLLTSFNKNSDKNLLPGGTAATVTRTNGAPLDVLVASFANRVGTNTIVPGADAFYVLSVRSETAPKPDKAALTAVRQESANMLSRAMLDDYSAFLSRQYPLKINQKMWKRMTGTQ